MVKIDDKIKEIITEIKLEEARRIAHRVNKIEEAQGTSFDSHLSYAIKNHTKPIGITCAKLKFGV